VKESGGGEGEGGELRPTNRQKPHNRLESLHTVVEV
jgi:hypothetical protein